MTAGLVLKHGRTMTINCDPCRVLRGFGGLDVLAQRRTGQPLRTMKFRCTKCRTLGEPWVAGWEDGRRITWRP